MELLLIRHALPQRVEVVGRPADPPLADLGRRQAAALADWLGHESLRALYVSPLRRAIETAQPLAATTGLDPVVEDGVAEFDRHAEAYVPIEELKAANDPRWHELLAGGYFENGAAEAAEFQRTVVDAIDRIVAAHRSQTVAVVCHGGVINAYVAEILGIDRDYFFRAAHCSVHRVLARAERRVVWNLNETAHLPGDLLTA